MGKIIKRFVCFLEGFIVCKYSIEGWVLEFGNFLFLNVGIIIYENINFFLWWLYN